MHYNENGMRVQAETKDGNKRYCIVSLSTKPASTQHEKLKCLVHTVSFFLQRIERERVAPLPLPI